MLDTATKNPRNAGRKRKDAKDKARTMTIGFTAIQADFVENNGRSKLIQRLVNAEMTRIGGAI
jgi:hypothetical protein